MNFNEVFLERMKEILGDEFDGFVESLNNSIQKSIYVNENKIAIEDFKKIVDFSIEQIPYEKAGFYVDGEKKGRHSLHHAGAFYMQEPSAMFTVNSVKFNGDEIVLDMCSAPGGKSIQIANRIPNGALVSNEIVKSRSEILYSNIERMGLKNVIITNETPEKLGEVYGNTFDVVLVDAPCSGEGMFRRGEDVIKEWYPEINVMCASRQLEILNHADKTLKQNGILVYSTCTYSLLENEGVVKEFLKSHNYELVSIDCDLPRGIEMQEAVRLYPHKVKGEGQFVAVLRKLEENTNSCSTGVKLSNSKFTMDFCETHLNFDADTLTQVVEYNNYSYYTPKKELVKKRVNYVSIGVKLGKVEKNRFEPHHNIFSAFGDNFKLKLLLDFQDEKAKKYLRGETFDVDLSDGYGAVLVNGCALGGFKISHGKLKNRYPKGLRNF
ncbi:MAG: RNA methyltransferase [Clostridia bacterium]|nr:RNA methyltransferase [Clostridia bacterium]